MAWTLYYRRIRKNTHILWITILAGIISIAFLTRDQWIKEFSVQEVRVKGAKRTPLEHILWGVHLKQGDSIWKEDLKNMKVRLETLSWIKNAHIRRILPGTIVVRLMERTPMAVWQHKGQKIVVDYEGKKLTKITEKEFPDLMVITGDEAPRFLPSLLLLLEKKKFLSQVKAASFLRSQRWNIYIKTGAVIFLPEFHEEKGLERALTLNLKKMKKVDCRHDDALLFEEK